MPVKNPLAKSLKNLNLVVIDKYGTKRIVPALDKFFAPRSAFGHFTSLITSGGHVIHGVELEEWLHEAEQFKFDMEFILHQAHHEFWSYMIHQTKGVLTAVNSMLQNSVPFYVNILSVNISESVKRLHDDVLNLIIRIILRILTRKESAECWIEDDDLAELIYGNYLISAPMLFDLIIAVGNNSSENTALLRKIFAILLGLEPKYKHDLRVSLQFLKTAFRSIQTQTENEGFEGAGGGASLDAMLDTPFDDVALYALNCSFTLSVLLDVCPDARFICEDEKFPQHISHFYDKTLRQLYENIYNVKPRALSLIWINQARMQFLRAFRAIVWIHIDAILARPHCSSLPSQKFIATLNECSIDQAFVNDYQRQYPIQLDVDIMNQACTSMDRLKRAGIDIMVKAYQRETNSDTVKSNRKAIADTVKSNQKAIAEKPHTNGQASNVMPERPKIPVCGETKSNGINGYGNGLLQRNIESEVVMVLDCFPDLGAEFVRRVLSRYCSADETIGALLEGNLPPDLTELCPSKIYIPPDLQNKLSKESGDKYDNMTNQNCIIKRGKGFPNDPKNFAQLLDDKTDINALRDRYRECSLVPEHESNNENEYDDDYDDTYENTKNENLGEKSNNFKYVLADVVDESADERGNENDGDESTTQKRTETNPHQRRNKSVSFRDNPEEFRFRRNMEARSKSFQKKESAPMHKNVLNDQKEKGQDKEIWRNYQKKEAQKSSRANHNRKTHAAYTRRIDFNTKS
ncbi:activating signal cointegrator 1 complex subunit 2-like [Glossina fuscipes fuscipes]